MKVEGLMVFFPLASISVVVKVATASSIRAERRPDLEYNDNKRTLW